MKSKIVGTLGVAILALVISSSAFAGVITQWNYNAGTLDTSIGTGSMAGRGGISMNPVTVKFDTDIGDAGTEGNSADSDIIANPAAHTLLGRAEFSEKKGGGMWDKAAAPGTQAVIWRTSTVGYTNIVVSMDVKVKDYDPRYYQLQYSLDGTNFITYSTVFDGLHGGAYAPWFNNNTMDLSGVTGASNNANFAFAFIMSYGPESSYAPAYAWDGTKKPTYAFDMVTVSSSPTPEPGALVALGSGLVGLLGLARKRRI